MNAHVSAESLNIESILSITLLEPDEQFNDMSDPELVIACQHRNKGALECLLKRHQRTITSILYWLAPDFTDTCDLRQEATIRIWRSLATLKDPNAFKSWLRRIVSNLFYEELRKRPRTFQFVSMDEPYFTADGSDNGTRDISDCSRQPEETILRKELAAAVSTALSKIAEKYRTAVILRDIEGRSYGQIAAITDTELGTVKSRISRGRRKVQKLLTPYLQSAS